MLMEDGLILRATITVPILAQGKTVNEPEQVGPWKRSTTRSPRKLAARREVGAVARLRWIRRLPKCNMTGPRGSIDWKCA